MCKFCDTYRKQGRVCMNSDTVEYSDIEIILIKPRTLRVRSFENGIAGFVSQDAIAIDYCPICGRKLEGD